MTGYAYGPDWVSRSVGIGKYMAQVFDGARRIDSDERCVEPRHRVTATDFPHLPPARSGKGLPVGWCTWYDWALVWRYWHRQSEGLRKPYMLEAQELLRLGSGLGLSSGELAERFGVSERTIERWRQVSRVAA